MRYAGGSGRYVDPPRRLRVLSTTWKIRKMSGCFAGYWKGTNHMDQKTYELGLGIRKDVIGKEFVEKAISTADDFTRPLQELVTRSEEHTSELQSLRHL